MLCHECNKRDATLHFTKILNGNKTEIHLCDQCAREKGEYIPGSNGFSIHQLLSGLLNFEQALPNSPNRAPQQIEQTCEKCGMTLYQFARAGRFGCAQCYQTFSTKLDPMLRRVHSGNTTHVGKIPKRIGKDIQLHRKVEKLKQQLQQHISKEEFEEAAKLRDEIRSLENSTQQSRGDD
ncbi:UvrB/UvrC motif-containing protein [Anaerobacillus isosaccharinicus]|uniref:UvrB/UvrC motif-containing protein n=1 Tax=Anaerobacillus isosaccharinicus TaxID=1532552 RepID=A0A1S2MHB7_9BACI|nr:UvrB/UvrC motif-containing protein [Anaerobacillus isosaccharinicus]MBA5584090.1 UvrB/UvrC motif-containing protein [Anaerobacillus isosaccharinicus]QOY37498.1 UvrB/UvrC motif-containing protein [Anaerobacillus isosaccharinicus]